MSGPDEFPVDADLVVQYRVRHLTKFAYTSPVSESVMELRMQPLSTGRQRCLRFDVATTPRARIFAYRDPLGTVVHYFDIPSQHARLEITTDAIVEMASPLPLPDALAPAAWTTLDAAVATHEFYEWIQPSRFTACTPALDVFMREHQIGRDVDPLSCLRRLTTQMFEAFDYEPQRTHVDSPIDDALKSRAGVCQDFAHIMIAICRTLGIPARYVSGYVAPRPTAALHDRSAPGATHAWLEAWLPDLGWIGLDPTNDTLARARHIGVAVGRDYADVPPTRGVFKGDAGSELGVAVSVSRVSAPLAAEAMAPNVRWVPPDVATLTSAAPPPPDVSQQQQQQQQ